MDFVLHYLLQLLDLSRRLRTRDFTEAQHEGPLGLFWPPALSMRCSQAREAGKVEPKSQILNVCICQPRRRRRRRRGVDSLEEVGRGDSGGDDPLRVGHRVKELGLARFGVRAELEDGGDVAAAVAVVGGRPHRHQLLVEHVLETCQENQKKKKVVSDNPTRIEILFAKSKIPSRQLTFLHELVRPADELEVVPLHELVGHLCPEEPPGAPRAHCPSLDLLGVGPDKITKSA
jgi:hypothetical protein